MDKENRKQEISGQTDRPTEECILIELNKSCYKIMAEIGTFVLNFVETLRLKSDFTSEVCILSLL